MYESYRQSHPGTIVQVDSFGPRYAQLVRGGLMTEVGEGTCPFTHQTVTHWDVTPEIPRVRLATKASGPTKKDLLSWIAVLQRELALKDSEISRLRGDGQGELWKI